MARPFVIDLFCGLGGWSKGFLSEGFDAYGFDIERHEYGEKRYPAQLILQDVLTLDGRQFKGAACIVASPPCQEFSYMAMPWQRAKQIAAGLRGAGEFPEGYTGSRTIPELTALFDACFRIAREAGCPLVVENVKGAQPWVGPARAHYGSYYLWGDVESVGGRIVAAGRPVFGQSIKAARRVQKFNPDGTNHPQGSWFAVADSKERGAQKREGRNFHAFENGLGSSPSFNGGEHETRGVKTDALAETFNGHGFNVTAAQRYRAAQSSADALSANAGLVTGIKQAGLSGPAWFNEGAASVSSKSDSRKAASAQIAEIPFDLAQWVARCFKP